MKNLGYLLKLIVIVSSIIGIAPSTPNQFLFFTIQSNIWICATCLVGLVLSLMGVKRNRTLSVLKLVFTISITLTGLVYCFLLAPFIESGAFALHSTLVHVVSPLAAVLDFFVCSKDYTLKGKDFAWTLIPPIYYLIFASIGYALNWQFVPGYNYPYFFLNWGSPAGAFKIVNESPYLGVMWYVVLLTLALSLIARLFILLSKKISKN